MITRHEYSVTNEDGTAIDFVGALLGEASGRREIHRGHDVWPEREDDYAGVGVRCSACRWTEARVYLTYGRIPPERGTLQDERYRESNGYVVEIVGRTLVPGEDDRHSAWCVTSPHSVVELLNSSRSSTLAARLALAEAAGNDDALEEAYINRAS